MTRQGIFDRVMQDVCERHQVSRKDVQSRTRLATIVRARHEVMWRLRTQHKMQVIQIGGLMDRDHTTVCHGIARHSQRIMEGADQ